MTKKLACAVPCFAHMRKGWVAYKPKIAVSSLDNDSHPTSSGFLGNE